MPDLHVQSNNRTIEIASSIFVPVTVVVVQRGRTMEKFESFRETVGYFVNLQGAHRKPIVRQCHSEKKIRTERTASIEKVYHSR